MPRMSSSPLTRERILRVALRMIDANGLSSLSMRKLGAKLGVEGTALYHHYPSKDSIIDAVIAQVMEDVDLAIDEASWVRRLRRILQSQRQTMLAHPNLVPAMATHPFSSMETARLSETILEVLAGAGLEDETALHGYQTLRAYVIGYAITETSGLLAASVGSNSQRRLDARELASHGLTRLVSIIPTAAAYDHDEDFTRGLEAIMTGLQTESLRLSLRAVRDGEND
jgi:TetR/AcrR family transcriptional regulator, tetracycline repressor protein